MEQYEEKLCNELNIEHLMSVYMGMNSCVQRKEINAIKNTRNQAVVGMESDIHLV